MRTGFNNITDSTSTEMPVRQAPDCHAAVHLYDSRNTPKLVAPLVMRTHYGKMKLTIYLNPTMGVAHPPDVMRNEDLIPVPKPNNAEPGKISVSYMPSGNVLVDEISDPRGKVLEARSGRIYGRNHVATEEWLSTEALVREAESQSVYDPSVRNSLIMAREMRESNCRMYPPQPPAMVLTGYHPVEAARSDAQGQVAPGGGPWMYPPSTSASAQLGLQMLGQSNQPWNAGQGRGQANQARGMLAPEQGGVGRRQNKSRERRKKKLASFYARKDIIYMKKSRAEFGDACDAVISHEREQHFKGKGPSLIFQQLKALMPVMPYDDRVEEDVSDDDMPTVE